jgi:hypothetical protein
MKREALAVLIGLALGLVAGLAWQGHRAAEAEKRAHTADSLYQLTVDREALAVKQRAAFDSLRADSMTAAAAALAVSSAALTAIRQRAAGTTARASAALAQAASLADTAATYKALYEERSSQLDDALASADSAHAAAGRLLAIIRSDSLELQKERARTAAWKRSAEVLQVANADLLKHRRPEFNLKLGLGGFLSGAAAATVVCVATGKCG